MRTRDNLRAVRGEIDEVCGNIMLAIAANPVLADLFERLDALQAREETLSAQIVRNARTEADS